MDISRLIEDAELILQIKKQVSKAYNENNKLQKQRGLVSTLVPVFVHHFVLKKQFIVSYVQAYDDAVNNVYIDGLDSLLHPKLFRNGAFIISKYGANQFIDGDVTATGLSPLNSTANLNESSSENMTLYSTTEVQLPIKNAEIVKCGTIFSTLDVLGGGKKEFHGGLGLVKTMSINLRKLKPLSPVDSRYLSAVYVQCLKLSTDDIGIFVLPCQNTKPLNITAMLCFQEVKTDDKIAFHVLKIRNLINDKSKTVSSSEEASYVSTYDILGDLKLESPEEMEVENQEESPDETSLTVDFHWSGGDCQILQHPPHSAKTVLKLKVVAGENRSAAHDAFVELTALDTVFNTSYSNTVDSTSSFSTEIMNEKLFVFKETVSDFSFYGNVEKIKEVESEKTDDLETPMSQLIQESFQRNDHDFTDKLWSFLRQTENVDEMRGLLDDILTDIVHGSLQPAISPTNDTKLGKYIRQMYLAETEEVKLHVREKLLEFLSSETSIQALVSEIGFEKLRKDYFNFFISKELASATNLRKLFKQKSGQVDMEALWKLHYCLEIVSTPAIYLNLAHDCQSTLLKGAVEYYSVNGVGLSSPTFCLSLLPFHDSSSSVHETCEARQAVSWQQGVIRTNKANMKETTLLHVTCKDVLPEEENIDFIPTQQDQVILSEEVVVLPVKKIPPKVNGH